MENRPSSKFYLGQHLEPGASLTSETLAGEALYYHPRDLTTHAVCLGMTGSGKTGLGVTLIEEAALNGIPCLVIDPKGDMANLLLAFPSLSPSVFRPWVDPVSVPEGTTLDEHVEQVARSWREGLAEWDMDGGRIARLKRTTEVALYTPGSDAGRQVSILQSLAAPEGGWQRDTEVLRETISNTVSALLTLIDIQSDPVTGREHNLLSTIIERKWRAGQNVDLAGLIAQVQNPPLEQLGVLSLETFYPEKERMALALALNGLMASPRFAAWLEGDPLRVDALLRAPDGRPQVSIFYLAHLSDVERLFFTALLLDRVRAWLRVQEGTSNLRAILYVDELYGMMPPYPANPPTKAPLLALLKQARSQGLGLVLASQNPVDLDYKGLSNAGTWFVGKLQTANDRQRVLDGLRQALPGSAATPSTAATSGGQALGQVIATLKPRTFVLHNVHKEEPVLFRTRQTMSYLRGPLTRRQIRQWMDIYEPRQGMAFKPPTPRPKGLAEAQPEQSPRPAQAESSRPESARPGSARREPDLVLPWDSFPSTSPMLSESIDQFFMPVRIPLEWAIRSVESEDRSIVYQARQLVYRPALLARATVHIDNNTHDVHQQRSVSRALPVLESDVFIDWEQDSIPIDLGDLEGQPAQGARFAPAPEAITSARRLRSLESDFAEYAYRRSAVSLTRHPLLKLTSRPDEPASQFRLRCYKAIEQERDADLQKLERQTEERVARLEARIRREERELEQDELEYQGRKREELISAGESVLNLLRRRRHSRALSIASRKRRLTRQAKADIEESFQAIDDLEAQIDKVLDEAEREQAAIQAHWAESSDDFETIRIRPRKSDIFVEAWGVVWLPYWDILFKDKGGVQDLSLPAFEQPAHERLAPEGHAFQRPADE